MKKSIITLLMLLTSVLSFGQQLNPYKYVVVDTIGKVHNPEGLQLLKQALKDKGFTLISKVTDEDPWQVVYCQAQDGDNMLKTNCTVEFLSPEKKSLVKFNSAYAVMWSVDLSYERSWKAVVKKLKAYDYKFTPDTKVHAAVPAFVEPAKPQSAADSKSTTCKGNGMPLQYAFGATVQLSRDAAQKLIAAGLLSNDDIVGLASQHITDDTLPAGTRVPLRCIEVGNQKLKNITATIADSATPLILDSEINLR